MKRAFALMLILTWAQSGQGQSVGTMSVMSGGQIPAALAAAGPSAISAAGQNLCNGYEVYAPGVGCVSPAEYPGGDGCLMNSHEAVVVNGQEGCVRNGTQPNYGSDSGGMSRSGDGTLGAPGSSDGTLASPSLEQEVLEIEQEYTDACQPKSQRAQLCCGHPERCLTGNGSGGDIASIGMQMMQVVGGAMATSAAVNQNCKKMQNVSYATAAINAAMSGQCTTTAEQCKSTCSDLKSRAQTLHNQIRGQTGYAANNSLGALSLRANQVVQDANRQNTECMTADNAAVNTAMQAIAATQAAKMAGLCKKATEASPTPTVESIAENDFQVNCSSPGAQANPICQQQCSRPGAQNDPACAWMYPNNPGVNPGFQNPDLGDGAGGASFDIGDSGDTDQFADPAVTDPMDSGLATVEGTGGGGGGGLSGGGGGGGGDYGTGGDASEMLDYNSKILRGLSGGQGYSSGGGFRLGKLGGGGSGERDPASEKPFNLRDFLPGGKGAAKRGLAALGGGHPEIGAKTDDIFKRISNRFHAICMQDRLLDCDTLRRLKRPQ